MVVEPSDRRRLTTMEAPVSQKRTARLDDRGLLAVTGADAEAFLGRLITQSPAAASRETAAHGALLTPQGKIVADFLMSRIEAGFLLDVPLAATADLLKRLRMFRLRAAVAIEDLTASRAVLVAWGDGEAPAGLDWAADSRLSGLGARAYPTRDSVPATTAEADDWHAHRVALGVPELGRDGAFGDTFPTEIGMDGLAGVDFDKGCYVGQEVVSRMRYRGTARRRPVVVTAETPLAPGAEILADGRSLGTLGSVAGPKGLAIVRLDRTAAVRRQDMAATAGGLAVRLDLPPWADYGWPDTNEAED
jgi:folate-binding protein YgfZ